MNSTDFPPGTIVIACGDLARYTGFQMSLMNLVRPPGTAIMWITGANIARQLNEGLQAIHGEWVWRMDDDHVFASDALLRLLARDVDLVAPLVTQRKRPFQTIVYQEQTASGSYIPWPMETLPASGLLPVVAGPGSGMLVRKHVLDAVGFPWFEVGQLRTDDLSEDLHFYGKARHHGFQPYIDLDVLLGHLMPIVVWPQHTPQGWGKLFDVTGTYAAQGAGIPQAGSYWQAMSWCLEQESGPILEIGMGEQSTPWLSVHCAHRYVLSLEHMASVYQKYRSRETPLHVFKYLPEWRGDIEQIQERLWSVALVDEEAPHRARSLTLLRKHANYIVVHDTEPWGSDLYTGMHEALASFRWVVTDKRAVPWTTVCSDLVDLAPLEAWLQEQGNASS